MFSKERAVALALAASLFAAVPATAQIDSREGIALQNQIQELRRDIQALQMGRGGGGGGSALGAPVAAAPAGAGQQDLLARLLERVSALETDLRLLRGRSDETQNAVRELQATVEKNAADTDYRLQQLEQGGQRPAQGRPSASQGGGQSSAALPRPPAAPPAPPAQRSQQQLLADGQTALKRSDWGTAERDANIFLSTYPRDGRVGEAHMLRGEALYGKRDYAQAALAFDDAQRRLTGNPQQEAQLRLGQSLGALNERASACEVFARLASQHAGSLKAEVRETLARERQRLRC